MRRRSNGKQVILDEEGPLVRPGAAALSVLALGLAGMIVWNAFYGNGASGQRHAVPDGASTHVIVKAPAKTQNTVTISYDARVEDVQRELSATGHFLGLVDGVMGKQTRLAIRKYQSDNGLAVTGEDSKELLNHIRYTRKVLAASEFTGSISAPAGAEPAPRATEAKPQGLAQISSAQKSLRQLGYEITSMSGELDEDTRSAVLKFQMDLGLAMDGQISRDVLAALKVSQAALSIPAQ